MGNIEQRKIHFFCFVLFLVLCSFLIVSCNYNYSPSDKESFAYDLRGTWVSNDTSVYSGTLIISYDRITIIGYEEAQTPAHGDDERRPFKNFTKGTALLGYSEEGQIFIQDAGLWQNGIPYNYWEGDYVPPDYERYQFLRFTFGGRQETLQKE